MVDPGDMPEPLSDGRPKNAIFNPPSEGMIVAVAVAGGERPAVRLQKGIGEPAAGAAEFDAGMAARLPVEVGQAVAVVGVGREGAVKKRKRSRRRKRVMVRVAGRGGKRVAREEMGGRRRWRRDGIVLVELGVVRVVMVLVVEVGVGMGVVEGGKREVVGEESGGGLDIRVEGEGVRRRIHCRRPPESDRRWRGRLRRIVFSVYLMVKKGSSPPT